MANIKQQRSGEDHANTRRRTGHSPSMTMEDDKEDDGDSRQDNNRPASSFASSSEQQEDNDESSSEESGGQEPEAEEVKRRRDFRGMTVFTAKGEAGDGPENLTSLEMEEISSGPRILKDVSWRSGAWNEAAMAVGEGADAVEFDKGDQGEEGAGSPQGDGGLPSEAAGWSQKSERSRGGPMGTIRSVIASSYVTDGKKASAMRPSVRRRRTSTDTSGDKRALKKIQFREASPDHQRSEGEGFEWEAERSPENNANNLRVDTSAVTVGGGDTDLQRFATALAIEEEEAAAAVTLAEELATSGVMTNSMNMGDIKLTEEFIEKKLAEFKKKAQRASPRRPPDFMIEQPRRRSFLMRAFSGSAEGSATTTTLGGTSAAGSFRDIPYPPKELICLQCSDLVNDPLKMPCCGKLGCKDCMFPCRWISCENCRADLGSFTLKDLRLTEIDEKRILKLRTTYEMTVAKWKRKHGSEEFKRLLSLDPDKGLGDYDGNPPLIPSPGIATRRQSMFSRMTRKLVGFSNKKD